MKIQERKIPLGQICDHEGTDGAGAWIEKEISSTVEVGSDGTITVGSYRKKAAFWRDWIMERLYEVLVRVGIVRAHASEFAEQ